MSHVFNWDPKQFHRDVESCKYADETPLILKYMPKSGTILEAGCGLSRYVKYLTDMGYDVIGIELGKDAVEEAKKIAPYIDTRHGDVTDLDFEEETFSGIISLGVVEHFIEGPHRPLAEMYRVLKQGGYALISVPCMNWLRNIKYGIGMGIRNERTPVRVLKHSAMLRKLFGKHPVERLILRQRPYRHKDRAVDGNFYEYYFTRKELESELLRTGFKLVESLPIRKEIGLYFELGGLFANTDLIMEYFAPLGKLVDRTVTQIPFFHNHMLMCVVTK